MKISATVLLATLLLGCTAQPRLDAPPPMTTAAPTGSAYQSLSFDAGTQRWWNSATVYEIWPRSFKDSDGDGNGDFNGMTSKLDDLKNFGVDAIWLTPMFEAPSYHGYDFQDFYNVERDYGTMAEFEHFVAESHQRGIKIILDLVLNHISDQHDWFLKSARKEPGYEDYFIWRDQRPAGWGQAWSDQPNPEAVWHWNQTRKAYYYGAFGSSQPDVNLRDPQVVAELDRVAAFWLKKGVDGFRLDAVRYAIEDGPLSQQADTQATFDYWTAFTKRVKAIKPDALLVGEAWAPLDTVGRYRNGGEGLDAAFDFDFGELVIGLLSPASVRAADFGTLSDAPASKHRDALWQNLQQRAAAAPMGYFSPFLTNHDKNRVMHTLEGDTVKARIAASLLLTSPGTAYLYYGEEIGMSQYSSGEDRYRRAPMQWTDDANAGFNATGRNWVDLPAPQGYRGDQGAWWSKYWGTLRGKGHSVSAQQADPTSLFNHYKRLIAVRHQNPNLQQPQELRYYPVAETNAWVLQARSDGRETWVLINLDPANAITLDVPAALRGERIEQLSNAKKTLAERATLNAGETWIF
ncbi:MAG: alpha-amylase family glycosyl hydrolase [Lysobacteraceae bacterium]